MKLASLFAGIALSCSFASTANAQWLDDFDPYAPGALAAQSLWDEWTGSSGVDADVDSLISFTPGQSVKIVTSNDVVWDFVNSGGRPSSGKWSISVKTFVPNGATGSAWYILLNDYPSTPKWSVQIELNATTGKVNDGGNNRGIRYGRWVSLVVAIDLDNDRYDAWYGDTVLSTNTKYSGTGGSTVIAVNDLYGDAGGCSGIYFDDDRLDKTAGGPLALTTKPNPIGAGATLNFYSNSPLLGAGDLGMLFLWSVNGSLFPLGLVPASYNASGTWTFSSVVPTGLAGLEVGFRQFALPAGGKVMMSNEDLVVFK